MKKAAFVVTTLGVLAATSAAFAADPPGAKTGGATTSAGVTANAGSPMAQPPVQTSQPAPVVPTSTTMTTGADATPAPPPELKRPDERDTVTLYQSMRPNRPLLYTGGIMLAGSYATTAALTAANAEGNADKNMYIPVVGPWLHLADSNVKESTTDTILIAGSGILQGAGLGLMISSLFVSEKIPAATITAGNVKMHITPTTVGRGAGGIGAVGTF